MTPDKGRNALDFYRKQFVAMGVPAVQFTDEEYDATGVDLSKAVFLAHCRWMTEKCLDVFWPEFLTAVCGVDYLAATREVIPALVQARASLEKMMRWLCYVQGVCHVLGLFTCNQLRDHSRGGPPVAAAG